MPEYDSFCVATYEEVDAACERMVARSGEYHDNPMMVERMVAASKGCPLNPITLDVLDGYVLFTECDDVDRKITYRWCKL